jgi:hypothetical protein
MPGKEHKKVTVKRTKHIRGTIKIELALRLLMKL